MSRVTNVILAISTVDAVKSTVDHVDENLAEVGHLPFRRVTNVDSEKNLEVGIYVAAFNHLRVSDLVWAIENVKWHRSDQVQLLIKPDCNGQSKKFEDISLNLE